MSQYVVAIGTACMDEYYSLPQWLPEGDKAAAEKLTDVVGGMIPNAACVLAGYGVGAHLLDVMRPGSCTQAILENLRTHGVGTSHVLMDPTLPDVKCFIFLTPGERTIFAVDGKKPVICPDQKTMDLLSGASFLYSTPSNFAKLADAAALATDFAHKGVRLALDVEAEALSDMEQSVMRKASVLFFNQYGFEKYRAARPLRECLDELFASGVEIVAVTLGKNGCSCHSRDEEAHVPGIPVQVVDPTGAGDTFNSSLLYCLMRGDSLAEAARFANAAAAHAVTIQGPHGGIATAQQVSGWMAQYYTQSGERAIHDEDNLSGTHPAV